MTVTHPLATAWLDRVERLATDLPPDVRAELLADLRDHLDAALPADVDTATVEAVLGRLGDPADVVAAARADGVPTMPPPVAPTPGGTAAAAPAGLLTQEVLALAALVLAGFVGFLWPLTILLWVAGIVLVAVAGRWRGGEIVAMVLLPVAWAFPLAALLLPVGMSSVTCTSDSSGVETCTEQASGLAGPWVLAGGVLLLVVIVLGTRWLARAPRGRPRRD